MIDRPNLSIITINLNNSNGLSRTISSVIKQSYTNYEFIVIDGSSNDDSVAIIYQYNSYITKWISEPDNGVYQAMNKGLVLAKGEYCLFLNSGDVFYSDYTLDKIFTYNFENCDIIYGDIIYGNNGKRISGLLTSFYDLYSRGICHQALLVKSSHQKCCLYSEEFKVASDWEFVLKSYLNNKRFKYINEVFCVFDNTGISQNWMLNRKERSQIKSKILSFPLSLEIDKIMTLRSLFGEELLLSLYSYSKQSFIFKVMTRMYINITKCFIRQ